MCLDSGTWPNVRNMGTGICCHGDYSPIRKAQFKLTIVCMRSVRKRVYKHIKPNLKVQVFLEKEAPKKNIANHI